jgi:hypothetical protein
MGLAYRFSLLLFLSPFYSFSLLLSVSSPNPAVLSCRGFVHFSSGLPPWRGYHRTGFLFSLVICWRGTCTEQKGNAERSRPSQEDDPEDALQKSYLTYLRGRDKMTGLEMITAYQIEQKIGAGTYGKVYRATHKATGYVVAIKTMEKARIEKQKMTEKVNREMNILELLSQGVSAFLFKIACPNARHG